MAEIRTEGRPSDELRVMVIDEDKFHANFTMSMLSELNYFVKVYTSPTKALDFLEYHTEDVDFVLASVHMEELNGFQFLETVKEIRKNLQVIMMSTETTMFTMKTCVELGARFLVKKPLQAETIRNVWQHLDANALQIEKMKYLFREEEVCGFFCPKKGASTNLNWDQEPWNSGVGDNTQDLQGSGNYVVQQLDGTKPRPPIVWTPNVERKFVCALQTLGENASPKKIQTAMGVDHLGRKQISSHLQKYRKQMEKEQNMKILTDAYGKGASSSKSKKAPRVTCDTHKYDRYNEARTTKRTLAQCSSEDIEERNAYSAMKRALQLGTFLDESQYRGVVSSLGSDEAAVDAMAEDAMAEDATEDEANVSKSSSDVQVVAEIYNAQQSTNKNKTPVLSLVDYPDSEDLD